MKRTAKTAAKRTTRAKLDLYATHKSEYVMPKSPAFVNVARACYLAIDGKGPPGSDVFDESVGALYNMAFTIKMAHKFAGTDYTVAKLEGLWWGESAKADFMDQAKEKWRWTLMIRTPDFITRGEVGKTIKQLLARGKPDAVKGVKRITLSEGKCVQMLHVGPYSSEPATVERMRTHAAGQKLRFSGTHHEIYLSDPRRVAAAKLRTILRIPVA